MKDEIVMNVYSTGLKEDPIFQYGILGPSFLDEKYGSEFEEENERFLGGTKAGEATEMQLNSSTTSKRSTRSTGSQTVTINNAVTPPVAVSFTVTTASASTPKFEQKKKKELIPIVPIAPITMVSEEIMEEYI